PVHDRLPVGAPDMYDLPQFMMPRERWFFTPILWRSIPSQERDERDEWPPLRERFAAARAGHFEALDDLLDIYLELNDRATRMFAEALLGAAGTDRQLERLEAWIIDTVDDPTAVCELCMPL